MSEDPTRPPGRRKASKRRRSGRRRRRRPSSPASDPSLAESIRLLGALLREGEDLAALKAGAAGGYVDVPVRVPLDPTADGVAEAENLRRRLESARADLLEKSRVFVSGSVFCLRCLTADCEHSAAPSERSVFAGYTATGLPRFADWSELLLERRDDRVDELHARPARLVVRETPATELLGSVLDIYRPENGFRLWGQVDAGWFRSPRGRDEDRQALSLQVLSLKHRGRPWRFGLNVVGTAPGGLPLETRADAWGPLPWTETVRWGRGVLGDIERAANTEAGAEWNARVEGLAAALARRLEKAQRAEGRKTVHAQERRLQNRPTGKALADLAVARAEQLLFDTRHDTVIVLGERGRAHAFAPDGRLVTSVRATPTSIARRQAQGRWRRAEASEIEALREAVRTS